MLRILNAPPVIWNTRHGGCSIFVANAESHCWSVTTWNGAAHFDKGIVGGQARRSVALSRSVAGRKRRRTSFRSAKAGRRCCVLSDWANKLGIDQLYIKDESQNPTQSFKARGMSAAVSMAKELGATKLAVPSAGNAAGALAAYAARAGLECFIFMPDDTPRANVVECEQTGAHVTLMAGLITDCGAEVGATKRSRRLV